MRCLLFLFLLFISSTAFVLPFDDYFYDEFHAFNGSSRLFQAQTIPPTPSQKDWPDPKTPEDMLARFKEDMIGILEYRNRAHFDDLAVYIKPNAQIHTCFAPGRVLRAWQFQRMVKYLAGFYQRLEDIRVNIYTKQEDYVHGKFSYSATGAHGEKVLGRWAFKASLDKDKKTFLIYYILFAGNCNDIPRSPPSDPTEDVDHYIERVRVKLVNGLFLPDGVPQTMQDFEDFGDFISEDSHFLVCDEEQMQKKLFINYMAQRYHHIRKYKDTEFSHTKNAQSFDLIFSTTWTASNTSQFRDTYVFKVQKEQDYYPEMDQNFFLWKIYWVTKKCTQIVTPEILLISGTTQIMEVNKRFTDMIDGQNWDVFQSFIDLFDASNALWGSCVGSRSQKLNQLRPYMEEVSQRYATAVVTKVQVRNMTSVDFTTTYFLSRANEVQEQEELDIAFVGYQEPKTGYWKMLRMYFECDDDNE